MPGEPQQIDAFIARWTASGAGERANCQPFLSELCELLGVPRPDPAQPDDHDNAYVFERRVRFHHGDGSTTEGRIDLYKRGCFVLEAKQGADKADTATALSDAVTKRQRKKGTATRATPAWDAAMEKARNQAVRYARALPADEGRPPLAIVVDVGHSIELYSEFTRTGGAYVPFPDPRTHRMLLPALRDEAVRERLRRAWTDPNALDPSRKSARVTREIADKLARLAKSLESSSHSPKGVAEFLMRCLFTMFAEDVQLLPKNAFTRMLEGLLPHPEKFKPAAEDLWRVMNSGGFHSGFMEHVLRFNGGLFATPHALDINEDQLQLLLEASRADWRDVEPAIFGTLLERALNPEERHKLGAHYTPRAYVERLVVPTIVEPLRDEWANVQAEAFTLAAQDKLKPACKAVHDFHRRLCAVRVLDPACGSGNFLYVTLEHLKRLEGELFNTLADLGEKQTLIESEGLTIDPHQLLGIEVNPRAAIIAELVLWIGYLQWHHRTHGDINPPEPVIKNFKNIQCRDAVLAYDKEEVVLDPETLKPLTRWDGRTTKKHPITGEEVPDESARVNVMRYVNPRPAKWPEADFVVGNPPFIGTALMRQALGEGYTETIRKTIPEVPESSDYVMYWWNHAAGLVRAGKIRRFGFITTNSLRQTFNRRVLERHLDGTPPLSLAFAVPDHPWVDSADGAAVRISMTVGQADASLGSLLLIEDEVAGEDDATKCTFRLSSGVIFPNLTIGSDLTKAVPLSGNSGISSRGAQLIGAGFIVSQEQAEELGLGERLGLETHIRPTLNGRDLAQSSRNALVIDLFGLTQEDVRTRYPEVYQWILERVKPERDHNNRESYRNNWWIFGEPRGNFRPALKGLPRYIATVETSKHRFFVFLDAAILPDNMLVNIASDDAYHLGVLSSRIHVTWALAQGSRLGVGNDPRYNKTRCFETFPFPGPSDAQRAAIRALAEQLDAHRKARQAAHPDLTMTGMYNVLEKLRSCSRGILPRSGGRDGDLGDHADLRAGLEAPATGGTRTDLGDHADPRAGLSAAADPATGGTRTDLGDHADLRAGLSAAADPATKAATGETMAEDFPDAFDPHAVEKRQSYYLPHWTQEGGGYFVTFRFADSLPKEVADRWYAERTRLEAAAARAKGAERMRLLQQIREDFSERMDAILAQGHGACYFKQPEAAKLMADALEHFDGERYVLWAYAVMPNHVHAVFAPKPGHKLKEIMHSWKSFTATALNKLLGRKGSLWQEESFDHLIRSQGDFEHCIAYTLENPANAGLTDWPWVGGRSRGILPRSWGTMTDSGDHADPRAGLSAAADPATPPATEVITEALTPKERKIHEQGLISVLLELHDALDAAVFDAYGWPPTLTDEEILERLVTLNAERAAEERQGHVRWLRPEFQCPEAATPTQTEAALVTETVTASPKTIEKRPWPGTMAAQAQAVREVLLGLNRPASAQEVAQAFRRARKERIAELLDTLSALGQCRSPAPGKYTP